MLNEPIGDFFNLAEHAETAVWSFGTSSANVAVIFSNAHSGVGVGSIDVSSTEPSLLVPAANVPGIAIDHQFVVRGATFATRDIEPDETGAILRVRLEKVS